MKQRVVQLGLVLLLAYAPALAQSVNEVETLKHRKILELYRDKLNGYYSAILQPKLQGIWWRDPEAIKALKLTADQQKRMDDVFQQHRLKLIELNASLLKEEAVLDPLVAEVRREDEARILEQIDRVAQVRAELEKTNARMLFGVRQVLTPEQWNSVPSSPRFKKTPLKILSK